MTTRRNLLKLAAGTGVATILATYPFRSDVLALQTDAEITTGGTLLDSLLSEPDSLDPHSGTLLVTTYVLNLLYDRLVYLDENRAPQPWLAESWTTSDDGARTTFKLRQGVTFHDGTLLDAEAVKFTFDRLIDPATASPNAQQIGPLASTQVIDELTVEMAWSVPYAPAMTMLAGSQMGIASPSAVQQFGDDFGRNPVGSGPFMFKQWDAGRELVFARNPTYQNFRGDVQNPGPPHLEEISIQFVPEEGTRMAALESGELHLAWAPVQEVEFIRDHPDLQLFVREKGTSWEYIEFNTTSGPFTDPNLRRAVGYAVNPEEILAASYIYGDLIKSPLPIGTVGYDPQVGEEHGFTYDPEQAKALLEGLNPGTLILTTWNAPQAVRAVQVIQAQLANVGLSVELETMDAGTFLAQLREGDFQFAFNRTTWPDPIILSTTFKSPGRDQQYSNPELDQVLEQIETTTDPAARQEAVSAAQRIILEDAAAIPLFSDQFMIAGRKAVQDFRFSAIGLPMYQDVWLKQG